MAQDTRCLALFLLFILLQGCSSTTNVESGEDDLSSSHASSGSSSSLTSSSSSLLAGESSSSARSSSGISSSQTSSSSSILSSSSVQISSSSFEWIDCGELQINEFCDGRDGQKYRSTQIGTQVWMAENLRYEYPESRCYENDCDLYGRFYRDRSLVNLCPVGWRVPSRDDYMTLLQFIGGVGQVGPKLKCTEGWLPHNGRDANGEDIYGFCLKAPGYWDGDEMTFPEIGRSAYLLTSTPAWYADDGFVTMQTFQLGAQWHDNGSGYWKGYSVRCIQGELP